MKSIYSVRMGLQYNAYPFEFTDHIVYSLKTLTEAHDLSGYLSEPIYFFPYKDGHKPARISDYNLSVLFRYLESKKIITLIASTEKEFYNWIKTPIVGMPRMRVNTRWKLKILDQDRLRTISRLVATRYERFNELDIRCDLTVMNDALYLIVNNDKCELKKFNQREAKDVFRRLSLFRVVERDVDGHIKGKGIGAGYPIGPLVDVVRNAGFKKKARNMLFYQCTKDVIELKSPIILDGEEINYILDAFIDYDSKNDKFKKSKNRDTSDSISGDNPLKPS